MSDNIVPFVAERLVASIEPAFGPHQPIDHEAVAADYIENAKREDAIARWNAHCPPELQSSDWTHPELQPHAAKIRRILAYEFSHRGIIASGSTGRGKSRAMWQLMRRLAVDELREVRYYHAADWFSTLQAQINYGRDDAAGWVEAVARRQVVFIDDLGQQSMQRAREDWAQAWFFRFLDIRIGLKLPLFITTNMSATKMAGSTVNDLRNEPLLRRLTELCEGVKFWDETQTTKAA